MKESQKLLFKMMADPNSKHFKSKVLALVSGGESGEDPGRGRGRGGRGGRGRGGRGGTGGGRGGRGRGRGGSRGRGREP